MNNRRLLLVPCLGLLITYVALNLMDGHGQPALLYIVPFTLGIPFQSTFFSSLYESWIHRYFRCLPLVNELAIRDVFGSREKTRRPEAAVDERGAGKGLPTRSSRVDSGFTVRDNLRKCIKYNPSANIFETGTVVGLYHGS